MPQSKQFILVIGTRWEGIAIGENNSGTIYAIGAPTALDRDGNEAGVDMETADTTNYSTYGSHPNAYRQ